jgi:CRISPR/Cas system-associated endonuclease Cas3-HD
MSDDRSNAGGPDRSRINVNEPYEVRYWCEKLNCSELQLRDAVASVGVMAKDVEDYLHRTTGAAAPA